MRSLAAPKRKKCVSAESEGGQGRPPKGGGLLRDFLHDAARLLVVAASRYVCLGNQPHEPAALLADGRTTYLVLCHKLHRLVEIPPRVHGGEIDGGGVLHLLVL